MIKTAISTKYSQLRRQADCLMPANAVVGGGIERSLSVERMHFNSEQFGLDVTEQEALLLSLIHI